MTREIADAMMKHLDCKGVGVIARGEHSCMSCRGVRKAGAIMITSAMLGVFLDDDKARAELLSLLRS
jgi:GTP cyclohydrolase I